MQVGGSRPSRSRLFHAGSSPESLPRHVFPVSEGTSFSTTITGRYLRPQISSTSPVTALISSKSPIASFAVVHLNDTIDWMVAQRKALLQNIEPIEGNARDVERDCWEECSNQFYHPRHVIFVIAYYPHLGIAYHVLVSGVARTHLLLRSLLPFSFSVYQLRSINGSATWRLRGSLDLGSQNFISLYTAIRGKFGHVHSGQISQRYSEYHRASMNFLVGVLLRTG